MNSAKDYDAIRSLKYAYLRSLDLKRWDEFESLFLPEATGSYAEPGNANRIVMIGAVSNPTLDV